MSDSIGGTGFEAGVRDEPTRRALFALRRIIDDAISGIGAAPGEPNGFPDRSRCILSWDDATRTITLTPNPGGYEYFSDGKRFTVNGVRTFQISDIEGEHLIYFDGGGSLVEELTFDISIITRYCFVAYVRWDATNKEAVPNLICEQHGSSMSPITHQYLHSTRGAAYRSGLDPAVISLDGSGDDDSGHFTVSSGIFYDEDIQHDVGAHAATDTIPVLYRLGVDGDWRMYDDDSFPGISNGTRAQYNEFTGATWQLTEVGQGNCLLGHLFAVPGPNSDEGGFAVIVGQQEYANITAAREGALTELLALRTDGLPSPEFRAVASFILQTSSTYANAANIRIRATDGGDQFIDWRTIGFLAGGGGGDGTAAWGAISGDISNQDDLIDLTSLPDTTDWYAAWAAALVDADYALTFDGGVSDYGSQQDLSIAPTAFGLVGHTGRRGLAQAINLGDGTFWDGSIGNRQAIMLEVFIPHDYDDAGGTVGLYCNGNASAGQHLYLDGMDLNWQSRRFSVDQGTAVVTLPWKGATYYVLATIDGTTNPMVLEVLGVGSDSLTPSSTLTSTSNPYLGQANNVATNTIDGTGITIGRVVADGTASAYGPGTLREFADNSQARTPYTPWIDVTFENSWYNYGGSFQPVQYRKVGDVVQIRGLARKNAAVTSGEAVFTLPTGFRPPYQQIMSVLTYANTGGGAGEIHDRIDILTTGAVQVSWSSSLTSGNWVSFHHSFSVT